MTPLAEPSGQSDEGDAPVKPRPCGMTSATAVKISSDAKEAPPDINSGGAHLASMGKLPAHFLCLRTGDPQGDVQCAELDRIALVVNYHEVEYLKPHPEFLLRVGPR